MASSLRASRRHPSTCGFTTTTYYDYEEATLGDLNGDDLPDLAVANQDDDDVTLLLNNGDGTFSDWTERAGFLPAPGKTLGVTELDVNSDGWPDVVEANSDGVNRYYLNRTAQNPSNK